MTASLKCPSTTLMAMGSTDPADLTDLEDLMGLTDLADLISMKDLADPAELEDLISPTDLEDLISPADPARRPDRLEVSKMRSKAMAQNH